jgi:hypothetical protein
MQGRKRMSDILEPPSTEAPANDQHDQHEDLAPSAAAAQFETADPTPARVPILSNATGAPPVAEPAQPPAEQRLPAPAPQHTYPQPYPQPYPPQRPQPVPYTPPTSQAIAVAEPPSAPKPDLYAPPPPPPQSRFWRAVKWPIRQAIKGIYLLFSAAGRHKFVTAIILGALLLFTGAGVVFYRALHPDAIDAHITTQANLPPLPRGVKQFIEGYHTYNGQEVWDSLSMTKQQQDAQQGGSAAIMASTLSQAKAQGISYEDFIYAGGYVGADGIGHYMIESEISTQDGKQVANLYFVTDPDGKILVWANLTAPSGNASGQ